MNEASGAQPNEHDLVCEAVRAHAKRDVLASLAYELLSRQAEGRSLYRGRKLLQRLGQRHGVCAADAVTDFGNLYDILAKGPQTSRERFLVAAFVIVGFEVALRPERAEAQAARASRFAGHCDWLETASPYVMFPLVDQLLEAPARELLWRAVGEAVCSDQVTLVEQHKVRARNALRISALSSSTCPAAAAALGEIVSQVSDPLTLRCIGEPSTEQNLQTAQEAGAGASNMGAARFTGRLVRAGRPWLVALRWLTGWALLTWLVRPIAAALGVRRVGEVELSGSGIRVRRRVSLLGRVIRESEEVHALDAVLGGRRSARYPAIHLLIGVVCLCAGVISGGLFAQDGVYTGDVLLLYLAITVVGIGALLDLLLDTVFSGLRARVSVDLHLYGTRPLRVGSVPDEHARRFLEQLSDHLDSSAPSERNRNPAVTGPGS